VRVVPDPLEHGRERLAGALAFHALLRVESVRASRSVAAPFDDAGLPLIDPAGTAAPAAALLEDGHANPSIPRPARRRSRSVSTNVSAPMGGSFDTARPLPLRWKRPEHRHDAGPLDPREARSEGA
jgi:hypothetical protein